MTQRPVPKTQRKRFAHPPPLKGKRPSKRRPVTPPYRGAPPWECSVYYWWWAYLRCNQGYLEACARNGEGNFATLYRDFGDVRGEDFWSWWKARGEGLFVEPPSERVQELNPGARATRRSKVVTVQIPLEVPLRVVSREIKRLVADRQAAFLAERAKAQGASRARYPVVRKPSLPALHRDLEAWKLRHQHPELKLYELGFVLRGITDPDLKNDANMRIELTNDVARRIRRARELIMNVGVGLFPLLGEPPERGQRVS
jgi:hypothetical protein